MLFTVLFSIQTDKATNILKDNKKPPCEGYFFFMPLQERLITDSHFFD